jgi:hypothetical protein
MYHCLIILKAWQGYAQQLTFAQISLSSMAIAALPLLTLWVAMVLLARHVTDGEEWKDWKALLMSMLSK